MSVSGKLCWLLDWRRPQPWTGTVTYGRGSDDWPETVCAENIKKYYERDTDVPTAAKPDF